MGYTFTGASVAFLGVPITEESFAAAQARFAAAGNKLRRLGPLPLLELAARQAALMLEADPFSLPGCHR